jgi:hypothetical protein
MCSEKRRRGKRNIPRPSSATARTRRKERKFLSNNKIGGVHASTGKEGKIRQRMMKGVGLARLYHGQRRKRV